MATIRLVPSSYYLSNSSYLSVSNASNMYDDTDSTTHGTVTHGRNSTSNTYYFYLRGFNFDDVPSAAVVSGFVIKIKASATGHTTSTSSSYYMSLANGTTQIGNTYASGRLSTTVTTFTFDEGSLDWDTITGYGANFGIRIPLRRASSYTADVVSIYGAEIEVTYTVPNPRTVTSTLTGSGTIDPSGAVTTYDGEEYMLTIEPANASDTVTATKNGVDITDQLVRQTGATVTAVPADVSVSGITSGSSYAEYAVGHSAESPSSSGTSSNMYASSGSTGYAEYTFDFSDIPSGVEITSIEVRAYGHRESSTIDSTHVSSVAIYNNGIAISDAENFPYTSNSAITVIPNSIPSSLRDVTVRHTVGYYGGLVLGISFEVTYEVDGAVYTYTYIVDGDATIAVTIGGGATAKMYFKNGSAWTAATSVYKKVSGAWVLQTDLTNVFVSGVNYRKG